MERKNRVRFLVGAAAVTVGLLCTWHLLARANSARVCQAVEQVMEKAYAVKKSPVGQRIVAKLGDFRITYGDVVVLAQELACYQKKNPAAVRPVTPRDLQNGFNALTVTALTAMAAKDRGVKPDWMEVAAKRRIELDAMAQSGDGAIRGVARARLRHLADDKAYTLMLFAGKEVVSSEEVQAVLRQKGPVEGNRLVQERAMARLKATALKYPLVIYDHTFKRPPWKKAFR
ncbi:hypothetical protein [Thermodesulfitimonas autotrophica]|uniref:hypothetical protein n=1 Tax=Thermodesulfitimonas autotrophica TaxID=1894989 RepID=UPI002FE27ED8